MFAEYLSNLSPAEILAIVQWAPAVLLGIGLAYKVSVIRELWR
jgi:hypothetical protein